LPVSPLCTAHWTKLINAYLRYAIECVNLRSIGEKIIGVPCKRAYTPHTVNLVFTPRIMACEARCKEFLTLDHNWVYSLTVALLMPYSLSLLAIAVWLSPSFLANWRVLG